MINLKKELLLFLKEHDLTADDIKAAEITYAPTYNPCDEMMFTHIASSESVQGFINSLDFEYDADYGVQHVFGYIWLTNPNYWIERNECDGSEWFYLCKTILIPEHLK